VATRSGDVLCSKNYEDPNDRHRLPVAFRPQALYKYDEFGPKEGVSGGGFIDVFGDLRWGTILAIHRAVVPFQIHEDRSSGGR
jgi:hypothetical protein